MKILIPGLLVIVILLTCTMIYKNINITQGVQSTSTDQSVKQPTTSSNPKIPSSPPDVVTSAETCIATYLGQLKETDVKQVPLTTCREQYIEPHLSFKYPCNWKITPMVDKEISKTCGYVRELYILAGSGQVGFLTIYPKDADVGYDSIKNTNIINTRDFSTTDLINSGWLVTNSKECKSKTIGNFIGELCNEGSTFVSKKESTLFIMNIKSIDYMAEIDDLIQSIELNYP